MINTKTFNQNDWKKFVRNMAEFTKEEQEMYESPITQTQRVISEEMVKENDRRIYRTIIDEGIDVDKEELLKALEYDRGQYEKGYSDGLGEGQRYVDALETACEILSSCHPFYVELTEGRLQREEFKTSQEWIDYLLSKSHKHSYFGIASGEEIKSTIGCPHCGSTVNASDNHCRVCGGPLHYHDVTFSDIPEDY